MALRAMVVTLLAFALTVPTLALAGEAQSTGARHAARTPEPEPEAQFPQERCVIVDVEVPSPESVASAAEEPARKAP